MASVQLLTFFLALLCCTLFTFALHRPPRQLHVVAIPSPPPAGSKSAAAGGSIEEKFQINKNSIIRTHDSRALGAKYINETDLTSNEECLRWCWNTSNCNLAVYEEKTRGSCYLFDCGPLDDFKCRFTGHNFYSSSVLQVNRNSFLLSEWKSQANQENELTGLKSARQTATGPAETGNELLKNQKSKEASPTALPTKVSRCRHYQFECRNNSECIAIYNVCDGIPQCSDGSDEAVELECHKSRLNSPKPPTEVGSESATKPTSSVGKVITGQAVNAYGAAAFGSGKGAPPVDLVEQPGKVLQANYPANYLNYNYPRSPNEKATLEENLLYAGNRAQLGADYSAPSNGFGLGSWNQYALPADVYKTADKLGFAAEPDQFAGGGSSLKDSSIYWPSFNYQNAELQSLQHSGHQQEPVPYSGLSPLSLAESRTRVGESSNHPQAGLAGVQTPLYNRIFSSNSVPFVSKTDPISAANGTLAVAKENSPAAVVEAGVIAPVNVPKSDYSHLSSSQKEVPVVSASIVAVSHLRDSSPQSGRETNSAVIALTLGLFVTSILVVIVGCRMKSFKKRIARRGRSLAHDADYLVNGMYL